MTLECLTEFVNRNAVMRQDRQCKGGAWKPRPTKEVKAEPYFYLWSSGA